MLEQKVFLFCCSVSTSCTFRSHLKVFPRCVTVRSGPAQKRIFLVSDTSGMGPYSRKFGTKLTEDHYIFVTEQTCWH